MPVLEASTALAPEYRPSSAWGYGLAVGLGGLAVVAAVLVDRAAAIPNLSLIFVLPVVIAAVTYGWGPSLVAALVGVAGFNFFLLAPRHSFQVRDPSSVWALVLLVAVAAIVSAVAAQSRRRAVVASEQAGHSDALQGLARALVAANDTDAIAKAAAGALGRLFDAQSVVMVAEGDDLRLAAATPHTTLDDADADAARWALASRLATRAGAYPVEQARFDFWPVQTPSRLQAVIGLAISGRDEGRPAAPERLVESVGGYLAVALEREHFAGQALEARVQSEGQRLKSDLLAAVSHDLRTPLSTILFTLQSLKRFAGQYDVQTSAELLDLAETETARLAALVANLLDMSRIDADAVTVSAAPAALADLVASAIQRAGVELVGHSVVNTVGPQSAKVLIDYGLAETALANVLANAGKYAPKASAIRVSASVEGGTAAVEVADDGPGFPEPIEPLFEKFARGVQGDGRPPGTGLGLAIARGFVEAFGGRIEARNRPAGDGATVRLWLPLVDKAP